MKNTPIITLGALILTGVFFAVHGTPGEAKAYKPGTCVVSGEELGSMGKPFKVTHDHTDVFLCCKSCSREFNEDPGKYAAMIKAAQ